MNFFVKLAAAVAGTSCIAGTIASLFVFGIVSEVNEWCEMPCKSMQSCKSPFSGEEVCGEIEKAIVDHGAKTKPIVWVKWTAATVDDGRAFRDYYGRELAGVSSGSHAFEVAYLPVDRVCATALRHEVRHVLLKIDIENGLHEEYKYKHPHKIPGWEPFDKGCR